MTGKFIIDERPHAEYECDFPDARAARKQYGLNVKWQCDECRRMYRVKSELLHAVSPEPVFDYYWTLDKNQRPSTSMGVEW